MNDMATKEQEEETMRTMIDSCFNAIERNDIATAIDRLTPDVEIWHNTSKSLVKGRVELDISSFVRSRRGS